MGVLTKTITVLALAAAVFSTAAGVGAAGAPGAGGAAGAGRHAAQVEDSVPTDGFAARIVESAEPPPPAPGLELPGLDGRLYNIADFRGSVVLLHFWASWCVPCRTEMPALKKLEKALREEGFVLLAVAEDSRKNAKKFAEEFGLDFRVLVDQYGAGMRRFKIKAIPSSVVIGRDGAIKAYIIGARDYAGPGANGFFERLLNNGKGGE